MRRASSAILLGGQTDGIICCAGTLISVFYNGWTLTEPSDLDQYETSSPLLERTTASNHARSNASLGRCGPVGLRGHAANTRTCSAVCRSSCVTAGSIPSSISVRTERDDCQTMPKIQPGSTDFDTNPADGPFADFQRSLSPLGCYGKPKDVAAAVAFLASPAA